MLFKLSNLSQPKSQYRWAFISLGFLLFALMFILDIFARTAVFPLIFYMLPVIYFGWFLGNKWGYSATVFSVFLWLAADIVSGVTYPRIILHFGNTLTRCAAFGIVAFLVLKLREEFQREKEANEKLKQRNAEIIKLAQVKSDFAAMTSHELRTPLAVVRESINVVADELASGFSEEQKMYLDMAKRNIERLKRLTDDVLDFHKMETGRYVFRAKLGNINKLILDMAAFHAPLAKRKGLDLKCELDEKVPMVIFDSDKIAQVLTNLLNNALKFTVKGEIVIGSKLIQDTVEIYVRDTGRGLSQADIKRLFKPFEQIIPKGEGRSEGTGLGLAISKDIIEHHGGSISVESKEGIGTTIHFSLPLNSKLSETIHEGGKNENSAHH